MKAATVLLCAGALLLAGCSVRPIAPQLIGGWYYRYRNAEAEPQIMLYLVNRGPRTVRILELRVNEEDPEGPWNYAFGAEPWLMRPGAVVSLRLNDLAAGKTSWPGAKGGWDCRLPISVSARISDGTKTVAQVVEGFDAGPSSLPRGVEKDCRITLPDKVVTGDPQ